MSHGRMALQPMASVPRDRCHERQCRQRVEYELQPVALGLGPPRQTHRFTKFGTRYYDPNVMRWTQRDPVMGSMASPTSLNPYQYGGLSPLNHVDRSGRVLADSTGYGSASLDDFSDGDGGDPGSGQGVPGNVYTDLNCILGGGLMVVGITEIGGGLVGGLVTSETIVGAFLGAAAVAGGTATYYEGLSIAEEHGCY